MTETSLHRVNTGTTYISLRRRVVRCSCSPSLRASASPNCSPRSACSRSSTCSPSKSTCSSAVASISPGKTSHSIPDQCPHDRNTFSNATCGAENCINRKNGKTPSNTFLPIPETCDNHHPDRCERRNSKSSLSPNSCIQESLAHGRGSCHSASPSSRNLGAGRNGGIHRDRLSPVRAASMVTPQGVVSANDRRHVKYMEDQL